MATSSTAATATSSVVASSSAETGAGAGGTGGTASSSSAGAGGSGLPECHAAPVGAPCSTGLCMGLGNCVPYIPVACVTAGGVFSGCDGVQRITSSGAYGLLSIVWGTPEQLANGTATGYCAGDSTDVGYCAPGTACSVAAYDRGGALIFSGGGHCG